MNLISWKSKPRFSLFILAPGDQPSLSIKLLQLTASPPKLALQMLVGTVYAASYTGDLLGVVLLPTASLDCFLQSWVLFVAPHSLDTDI